MYFEFYVIIIDMFLIHIYNYKLFSSCDNTTTSRWEKNRAIESEHGLDEQMTECIGHEPSEIGTLLDPFRTIVASR